MPRVPSEVLEVDPNITTLERAFQLARSGQCSTLDDIKQRLKAEGYQLLNSPVMH